MRRLSILKVEGTAARSCSRKVALQSGGRGEQFRPAVFLPEHDDEIETGRKRPGCQLPSRNPAYEPGVEHQLRVRVASV